MVIKVIIAVLTAVISWLAVVGSAAYFFWGIHVALWWIIVVTAAFLMGRVSVGLVVDVANEERDLLLRLMLRLIFLLR